MKIDSSFDYSLDELSNSRIRHEKSLLILVLLFSGRAIPFYSNHFSLFIPLLYALALNVRFCNISISRNALRIFAIYFALIIIYFIKFNFEFDPIFFIRYFLLIGTCYLVINLIQVRLFEYFTEIIVFFAVTSLILFSIQLLIRDSFIEPIVKTSNLLFDTDVHGKRYGSILIYTVNVVNQMEIYRNAGFCWEPGPFSCFLVLGMFTVVITNGVNIKKILILLIALITTQSTTGFVAFFILTAWYIFNRNVRLKFILTPIIVLITVLTFINAKFLNEKILREINDSGARYKWALEYNTKRNVSIGRFSGLLLNFDEWKLNPLFGYGGHFEELTSLKESQGVHSTNGLGSWLAQFGLIGLFILVLALTSSIKWIASYYDFKGVAFLVLMFLVFFFGFGIIDTVLIFCFILFSQSINQTNLAWEYI